MTAMGLSTALVGLLPTYEQAGIVATIALVLLRLLQGLAIGGEYGGAVTYVAEHVPDDKRGYYTSFIQTTATLGLLLSLAVIGATRIYVGEAAFREHWWRLPFLLSFLLLAVSIYVRLKMAESPLFAKLKKSGRVSRNPFKDSFTNAENLRYVLIALSATAGQAVVWYTGQFYALTFLQSTLHIAWQHAYLMVSIALVLATPFYVAFGALSDRIGRKSLMMVSSALAALTYVPIYMAMKHFSNPAGQPSADPAQINWTVMIALLFIQMIYAFMIYAPLGAFLVELFPTRIRYTSMSVPYHVGVGWFGGFLPLIATALTASTWARERFGDGAIYAGLLFPIAVCVVTIVIGMIWIRETKGRKLDF